MKVYSQDSASLPPVLCADALGLSLSVLFSFSWFIIMFGIILEMCNSVKIVAAFLVYLHSRWNSDIKGLQRNFS